MTRPEDAIPAPVAGLTNMVGVGAGEMHALAVRADGTVWGWGDNTLGQLGTGGTGGGATPVQAVGIEGVVSVAAGAHHSLALKQDGTVWAWGMNYSGQLGDGTMESRFTPVQVQGLDDVRFIAATNYTSMAMRGDGSVWTWGESLSGFELLPQKVEGLVNIHAVSVGWHGAYALREDGTLWQWFGHGAGTAPPAQVEGITDVVAIAPSNDATLHVVRANGTVWGRGTNIRGVLGVPDVTRSQDWIQVPGLTDVVSLSMGMESRMLAVRANGTAVSWGSNASGSIGDGISPLHLTPTRVLMPCRLLAEPSWESLDKAQRCRAE
jgi:alpha-tubulin suppressor-like RCC1 family protein